MMLSPIKTFLTYLQKNANTSTLFTSSSRMNDTTTEDNTEVTITPVRSSEAVEKEKNENDCNISVTPKSHDQNENEVIVIGDGDSNDKTNTLPEPSQNETDAKQKEDESVVVDESLTVEEKDKSTKDVVIMEDPPQNKKNESTEDNVVIIEDPPQNKKNESTEDDVVIIENPPHNKKDISTEGVVEIVEEPAHINKDKSTEDDVLIIEDPPQHNNLSTDQMNDPLSGDNYQADVSTNNNNSTTINTTSSDLDSSTGEMMMVLDGYDEIPNLNECNPEDTTILLSSENEEQFETSNLRLEETSEEQEVRSDGSDSGLGSETSTLQTTNTSVTSNTTDSPVCKPPSRSNLKRRLDDCTIVLESKRQKRTIHFSGVSVYYFPRMQGFACVPSQGGCTLGMAAHHINSRSFSLAEHAAEQRRVHKQQMQEINPRSSSSDETDSDEEISEASGSDLDADANGFLQPVPAKQRRALLKAAGIRKIDPTEKDECRAIRSSREFCGCSCKSYCDPDTCSCSQAGIKCQVDRPSFPCGCTRDGCGNVVGRVEFNPSRVRTHYIHTIMRLELENKPSRPDIDTGLNFANSCGSSNSVTATISSSSSSLNNICNYNLVNTNHIRPQPYGHMQPYAGHNHCNIYSNPLHSGIVASQLPVDGCLDAQNVVSQHLEQQQQQHIVNDSCNRLISSNSNSISDSLSITPTNTSQNHHIDLHYVFRDENASAGNSSNSGDTTNTNGLLDFPTTSNQLYHEIYNSHSFLSPTYHNSTNSNVNNFTTSQVPSLSLNYPNYQQNFNYISQTKNSSNPIEITDLTENDDEDTNSNFISLPPLTGNSSKLCDLQNTTNTVSTTTTSVCNSLTKQATVTTSLTCNLASSAQTSTSITEGTLTVISPALTNSISHVNLDEKLNDFVDLTESKPNSFTTLSTNSSSTTATINCTETNREVQIDSSNDSVLEVIDISDNPKIIDLETPPPAPSTPTPSAESSIITTTPPSLSPPLSPPPEPSSHKASDENLTEIINKSIVETVSA